MATTEAPADPHLTELNEWASSSPLELGTDERRALETHFGATVTTAADKSFRARPGSIIGSITIGNHTIVVRPKLPIDRVLFMTAYATAPNSWHDHWTTIGSNRTLVDGIAALFINAYERTTAQGLLRFYRTVDRDEAAIKGRIRWQRQARRPAPLPIALRYQVHDDDIIENQLLRAATAVLRQQRLTDAHTHAALSRIWRQLRDLTAVPVTHRHIDRLNWTRQNVHYRPLLQLARTILEGAMVDVKGGAVPVTGFTLRLYDVFEQFVRTALREAIGATPHELPDNPADHHLSLDQAGRIRLLPDLGLRVEGTWRFVGDVKYKHDTGAGHNPDLYQLLAYAAATSLPTATLIYADGPPADAIHHVRGTQTTLRVRHLNLDQNPISLLHDLRLIGKDIMDS